jgi:hypothetical protein
MKTIAPALAWVRAFLSITALKGRQKIALLEAAALIALIVPLSKRSDSLLTDTLSLLSSSASGPDGFAGDPMGSIGGQENRYRPDIFGVA